MNASLRGISLKAACTLKGARMANKKLIESLRKIADGNRKMNIEAAVRIATPVFYAALALTLKRRRGWGIKRISQLISETEEEWSEFRGSERDMLKACADETDIILCLPEEYEDLKMYQE